MAIRRPAAIPHHRFLFYAAAWRCGMLVMCACLAVNPARAADTPEPASPGVTQLRKIQAAARELDYAGVFTYQQGASLSSSRIVHLVDGTGERERIEVLDGEPREFLRHNDDVQCLIPQQKLIVKERRRADRFPALLLGDAAQLAEHYDITMHPTAARVAGRECTIVEVKPHSPDRYGYRICSDARTNLMLKTQTLGPSSEVIDQVSFTSVQIGGQVPPEQLTPSWNIGGWRVLETPMDPVDLAAKGWRIPLPSGFRPLIQVSRPMPAGRKVSQMVVSDGLAAISVFIERQEAGQHDVLTKGSLSKGALNVFRTRIGDHWLTAIGEVPIDTLRDIGEHTEYVPMPDRE